MRWRVPKATATAHRRSSRLMLLCLICYDATANSGFGYLAFFFLTIQQLKVEWNKRREAKVNFPLICFFFFFCNSMLGSAMKEQTQKGKNKSCLVCESKGSYWTLTFHQLNPNPKHLHIPSNASIHFAFLPFCFLFLHFSHFWKSWILDHFSKPTSQFMKDPSLS